MISFTENAPSEKIIASDANINAALIEPRCFPKIMRKNEIQKGRFALHAANANIFPEKSISQPIMKHMMPGVPSEYDGRNKAQIQTNATEIPKTTFSEALPATTPLTGNRLIAVKVRNCCLYGYQHGS